MSTHSSQRLPGALLCLLTVAAMLVVATPARAAGHCPTAEAAASSKQSSKQLARAERALHCLVNVERRNHGLRPVRGSGSLQRAAIRHTRAMLETEVFEHRVAGEASLDRRVKATGYLRHASRWWLGEAIAFGAADRSSPAALMGSLMASPPHRAIILDPQFRDLGVGLLSGIPEPGGSDAGGATLTLDFGRVHTR